VPGHAPAVASVVLTFTRDTRGHTGTRITLKNLTTIPKSRAPAPHDRRALTQGDTQDTHGSHTRITFIERLCCALQYHCLTPMLTPVWYHSAQAPSMVQLASSESSHRDGARRRAMVPVLCQAVAGWLASRRASSHPAVAHIRRPQQWRQTRGTWPWLHRRRGARRSAAQAVRADSSGVPRTHRVHLSQHPGCGRWPSGASRSRKAL